MGTRICVMNTARVVQIGAPLDVYWQPADTFVARFLGVPPMNLMPGRPARPRRAVWRSRSAAACCRRTLVGRGECNPVSAGRITVGVRPEEFRLAGRRQPTRLRHRRNDRRGRARSARKHCSSSISATAPARSRPGSTRHKTAEIGSPVRLGLLPRRALPVRSDTAETSLRTGSLRARPLTPSPLRDDATMSGKIGLVGAGHGSHHASPGRLAAQPRAEVCRDRRSRRGAGARSARRRLRRRRDVQRRAHDDGHESHSTRSTWRRRARRTRRSVGLAAERGICRLVPEAARADARRGRSPRTLRRPPGTRLDGARELAFPAVLSRAEGLARRRRHRARASGRMSALDLGPLCHRPTGRGLRSRDSRSQDGERGCWSWRY